MHAKQLREVTNKVCNLKSRAECGLEVLHACRVVARDTDVIDISRDDGKDVASADGVDARV
jgi:hypothetical protein